MQFAVAAYACPDHQVGQTDEPALISIGPDIHHMVECNGMDLEQLNLCHAHDQVGTQSLDKPELPQVQPFIAAGLALMLQPLDVAYRPLAEKSQDLQLARSTAPPLAIQNCCFRI